MGVTQIAANEAINEGTTGEYSCAFTTPAGAAINGAAITAITATLRDVETGAVVNSRNAQSVLNANGGSVSGEGVFTLTLSGTGDHVIVAGNTEALVPRRLTLRVTYDTGSISHVVQYFVRSLGDVS